MKKVAGIIAEEMKDEALLYNTGSGEIHVLNETGYAIWCLLDRFSGVDEICSELAAEYGSREQANQIRAEVESFLSELHLKGLLVDK